MTYRVVKFVNGIEVPEHVSLVRVRPKCVHTMQYCDGPDGGVLDHKLRLVALGDWQVENKDHYNMFSPVLKYLSRCTPHCSRCIARTSD